MYKPGCTLLWVCALKKVHSNRLDERVMYPCQGERPGPVPAEFETYAGEVAFIQNTLGLRALQWGNYVPHAERIDHERNVALAIMDLEDVLGAKRGDIGRGLAVSIGARGRGGRAAGNYSPTYKISNLTRRYATRGILAHEIGHALDHRMGGDGFLSETYDKVEDSAIARAMSGLMTCPAFKAFRERVRVNTISGYWREEIELFARAFELFVLKKLEAAGRRNTYLAGLVMDVQYKELSMWPTEDETLGMLPMFENLFAEYFAMLHFVPAPVIRIHVQRGVAAILRHASAPYQARRPRRSRGNGSWVEDPMAHFIRSLGGAL